MNLKLGDKSEQVREWQEFLARRGYGLRADGHFGPKTAECTRLFQLDKGLTADGVVGQKTYLAAAKAGFVGGGFSKPAPEPKPEPKPEKLYLISAGHTNKAGKDRGVGANGLIEGEEAVAMRDIIAGLMRSEGHAVIEDGADGVNDPLAKALVLARKSDVAVEIHFNASANAKATGIEVLAKEKHRSSAIRLAGAVAAALGLPLRGGDGGYKSDKSGQHHRLAFCEAGGMILEVCFLTNPDDVGAYRENFEALCAGIAEAIA